MRVLVGSSRLLASLVLVLVAACSGAPDEAPLGGGVGTPSGGGASSGSGGGPHGSAAADAGSDGGTAADAPKAFVPTGPPGSLDTSFGATGYVSKKGVFSVSPGWLDRAALPRDLAIDSQDRIVIAGEDGYGPTRPAVWRVAEEGVFDPTFAAGGEWVSPVTPAPDTSAPRATALCVDPQDRPMVIGQVTTQHRFDVWRLTAAGQHDPGFNGTGSVTLPPPAQSLLSNIGPNDVGCDRTGRTVVSGNSLGMGVFMWRFLSTGVVDTGFNAPSGYVNGPRVLHKTVRVDGAARIYFSFYKGNDSRAPDPFGLVRLLADGTLDTSYGTSGTVKLGEYINDCQVDPSGRAYVVMKEPGGSRVMRMSVSGAPDPTFGSAGSVLVAAPHDSPASLAIDSKGRVILMTTNGTSVHLWRLSPGGVIDPTFAAVALPDAGPLAPVMGVDSLDRPVLAGRMDQGLRVYRLNP